MAEKNVLLMNPAEREDECFRLDAENKRLRERVEAAEAIVAWHNDDADPDHCMDKPDDLEQLYVTWEAAREKRDV